MTDLKILPMGFDNERFDWQSRSAHICYTCEPCPGLRVAMWPDISEHNQVLLNLYRADVASGGSLTHRDDRAIPAQEPISVENDPLILQARILHLVERYKATLPTEVTNEAA